MRDSYPFWRQLALAVVSRCPKRRGRDMACFAAGHIARIVGADAAALEAAGGPCCQPWMAGFLAGAGEQPWALWREGRPTE